MSYKCPHCEEEIDHLRYNVRTTCMEYGTAALPSRETTGTHPMSSHLDYDSSDSDDNDWDGSPEHECPECNTTINPNSLIWTEEEEEKIIESIEEEERHLIIRPQLAFVLQGPKDQLDSTIICKHCRYAFANQTSEYSHEHIDCPKCGESNTTEEYKELIEKGFFNKPLIPPKDAKHPTKKIKLQSRSKSTLDIYRSKLHS